MYYLELTCTLKFDSGELKAARQWWKDKKFSEEKDEMVLYLFLSQCKGAHSKHMANLFLELIFLFHLYIHYHKSEMADSDCF